MTYSEEEQQAQSLGLPPGTGLEPGLVLGTIEEGQEGSLSEESEEGLPRITSRPEDLSIDLSYSVGNWNFGLNFLIFCLNYSHVS